MPTVKKIIPRNNNPKGKRGRKAETYINYVYQYTDKKTGITVQFNTSIKDFDAFGPHGEHVTLVTSNRLPYNQ